jgi:hypothetical protein
VKLLKISFCKKRFLEILCVEHHGILLKESNCVSPNQRFSKLLCVARTETVEHSSEPMGKTLKNVRLVDGDDVISNNTIF